MNTLGRKKKTLAYFVFYCCDKNAGKNKIAWEGDDFILQYLGHNPSLRELKIRILRQEL